MAGGPKVAILGAGSIGCFIGGCWLSAGLDVSFVGRRKLSNDIDEHGLTLSDYSGWQAHVASGDVDYRCGPEGLDEAQIIALCVKSGDTRKAAAEIAVHATAGATIISFQNGVSNVDILEQGLGGRFEVARGMVPYNVAYMDDGKFHKGVAGDLFAARRDGTRTLAEAVAQSRAPLTIRDDMLGVAWGKLLINLNNAINALSGRTLQDELKRRDYRRVFAAAMREGLDLLERADIQLATVGGVSPNSLPRMINAPDWLFNNVFLKRWKIDAKARSSMADDLAAGRPTEIDFINGELVRLAERLQRSAPVNSAIVELVRKAEAGAGPLSPAALRKTVLAR